VVPVSGLTIWPNQLPFLLVRSEENISNPTFLGPAITLAQTRLPAHSVTSILNFCHVHLPNMSLMSAAEAEQLDTSASMLIAIATDILILIFHPASVCIAGLDFSSSA
jgi:hypothetical protein